MDDRELLELAAKAAGIGVSTFMHAVDGVYTHDAELWNPLTDDGDALRLAVAIGFTVEIRKEDAGAFVWKLGNGIDVRCWARVREAGNLEAATRLAIVRAAAEIGRTM